MRLDIFATFTLADVAQAHAVMDANEQIGKLVLIVDPELAGSTPHLSDRVRFENDIYARSGFHRALAQVA